MAAQSPAFAGGKKAAQPPKTLDKEELLKVASASFLGLSNGEMVLDNDLAFEKKIAAIEGANGRDIRAIYYIYSDDQSSSRFSKALLKAAENGSNIYLMVDYLTNYKSLDLFTYLQTASNGKIKVKLYGRPTVNILKDAYWMTMECPNPAIPKGNPLEMGCKHEKRAKLAEVEAKFAQVGELDNLTSEKAGLFLSGLYSKNPSLMVQAMVEGQKIDLNKIKAGASEKPMTKEDKEGLQKLAKLYWDAKVHGSFTANLSLFLASIFYSEQIRPVVNGMENLFPFAAGGAHNGRDMNHISDYTHHKMILVSDSREDALGGNIVMGGRNIENSYHMRPNPMLIRANGKPKYVFMDTDFSGEFANHQNVGTGTAQDVADAYDRMWKFDEFVASLDDVQKHAPNDVQVNLARATAECKVDEKLAEQKGKITSKSEKAAYQQELQACIQAEFVAGFQSRADRHAAIAANMKQMAEDYETTYVANIESYPVADPDQNAPKSISIGKQNPISGFAHVFYLENTHFHNGGADKKATPDTTAYGIQAVKAGQKTDKRVFEAVADKERLYSKNIHHVVVRSMQNVCLQTQIDGKPRQVIIHNAYVVFPSDIAEVFVSMFNGELNCKNVTVSVITNSIKTTDLNVINPIAKMGLHALAGIYKMQRDSEKGATFKLYEYNDIKSEGGSVSLHSKVWVLGDDIVIGSANADVRSFMMDTNNAMFIRNAPALVNEYTAYLTGQMQLADRKVRGAKLVELTTVYAAAMVPKRKSNGVFETQGQAMRRSYQDYLSENETFLKEEVIEKWGLKRFASDSQVARIQQIFHDLQQSTYRDMLLGMAEFPTSSEIADDAGANSCWIAEALDEVRKVRSSAKVATDLDQVELEGLMYRLRHEGTKVIGEYDRRIQLL